ncbi:UNC93-like protein MFSD11 [Aplysia californica]|uniref:UNC93-like protein MFSD11 n=1 Tax=Aplysia californica TaxID=6500 RepID=A0ABM0JRZ1_APLCA|nr:UNC93-like protein MFSD11 [Aplysia californica]
MRNFSVNLRAQTKSVEKKSCDILLYKMAIHCCEFRLFNIVILGVSFMLIFTAFQTCSMVEKTVLDSVEKNNGTAGNAYTSLGILYAVFSVSNWAAPSFVAFTGPKIAMFIGSLMYFLFVLQFLKPMVWALYLGSVLVGFGAAILWTGQGNFLTINSDSETVSRNSGIFWALLQCSLLFGNMYSYFVFQGATVISSEQRTKLFIALSAAGLLGCLCLLLLRKRRVEVTEENALSLNASSTHAPDMPLTALKRAFQLLKTREMLLLCFAFAYTGLELTFFSGVYGASISHTESFGNSANGLLGISGIFIGVGEILGGALFGLAGKRTNVYGRDPIIMLGYVAHMTAFYLIFLNLPDNSPIEDSLHSTYITPNKYVAILCSFLLGFGDSSFNTQIYSLVGFMFQEDSSPAFALFKFVQSVAAAGAFYYSNVLLLQWQLLILVLMGSVGALSFCCVEWMSTRASRSGYQTIGLDDQ